MSERLHGVPTPEGEYFDSGRFAGLSFVLGVVAVIALVLCAVGAIVNPHQFGYSWLFAFAFFFTLCAGCFFWTIVHHATDAEWSVVVRRQLENLGALLTALALLFVPILLLRHHLFVWMDIPPGVDPSLDTKRAYLNWPFFFVRAVVFLGFFLLAALALRRLSVRQDSDGNPRFTIGMRTVSFISLPMFALCLTFGAFDWLMSLNYRWFSTMFGVYIFAGAAGSSMSLLVLVITALRFVFLSFMPRSTLRLSVFLHLLPRASLFPARHPPLIQSLHPFIIHGRCCFYPQFSPPARPAAPWAPYHTRTRPCLTSIKVE